MCDTLEPPYRDLSTEAKILGHTAIPYGTYQIKMLYSPHFTRLMPHLVDVPEFAFIMIHPGNHVQDTSGCILVGQNKIIGGLINSVIMYDKLRTATNIFQNCSITVESMIVEAA